MITVTESLYDKKEIPDPEEEVSGMNESEKEELKQKNLINQIRGLDIYGDSFKALTPEECDEVFFEEFD